jgi:hypothetical protein
MRVLCLFALATLAACSSQSPKDEAAPAVVLAEAAAPAATAAVSDDFDEFKPPAGYKRKVEDGRILYCAKVVVLGSRFPKDECRTQAELEEMEVQRASMRGEMGQKGAICSGAAGCSSN